MDAELQRARFDEWLHAHFAILDRAARGFARDPVDRADLLQELMLAVWKAIPAYREQAQVSTFVYRVAHNAAMTWTRARRRARGRDELAESVLVASGDPDDEDERERAVRLERLYAAIRELAEVDRSLILLALDGVAHREIAAIHGLSETNVGVRLHRIRKRLAERLDSGETKS
ncbi:RNA polymerase sigma factor [Nannocystaceae bacterium ST9]